jgi:hypothetical protein
MLNIPVQEYLDQHTETLVSAGPQRKVVLPVQYKNQV